MRQRGFAFLFAAVAVIACVAFLFPQLSAAQSRAAAEERNAAEVLAAGSFLEELELNFDAVVSAGLKEQAEDSVQQKLLVLASLQAFLDQYNASGQFSLRGADGRAIPLLHAIQLAELISVESLHVQGIGITRFLFHGGLAKQQLVFSFKKGAAFSEFVVPLGYEHTEEKT